MHYPTHLAIIPDGNRTRAKQQGKNPIEGHLAGQENGVKLAQYIFQQTPVSVFTMRGLSTENLKKRSREEISYLTHIYKHAIDDVIAMLKEQQVSFYRKGNPEGLPQELIDHLIYTEKECSFDTERALVTCVNYGGRDEIIRGIKSLHPDELASIDEASFQQKLDFAHLPPVDLVVRTKGDKAKRLSGFMLRRIGYAELYFTKHTFPSFDVKALEEAFYRYDNIVGRRNFGK